MGFDPDNEETISKLHYKFTKFGGQEADIPEPSDDLMLEFWQSQLEVMRVGQDSSYDTLQSVMMKSLPGEAGSEERKAAEAERDERLRQLVAEIGQRGMKNIDRRREVAAAVCNNQPSVDELKMLPYRIFNAFEGYLMRELSPEGLTAVLNL